MSRKKLLINNIIAFGGINLLNKLFPLLLLPLLTRIITDPSIFGAYDVYLIIVSFGASIANLGLYDIVFRGYFETESIIKRKLIISTGFNIILIFSILLSILSIVFSNFLQSFFPEGTNSKLILLCSIGILVTAINNFVLIGPRIVNNKIQIGLFSIGRNLIYYVLVFVFIYMELTWEILIYPELIALFVLTVLFYFLYKKEFVFFKFSKKIALDLLKLALPLMPIFIIYWVFKTYSRITISQELGIEQLGIYSVGARFAAIGQFLQVSFSSGWAFFTYSTMKDIDQKDLKMKILEVISIISFLLFSISIVVDKLFLSQIIGIEYIEGISVFSYLFFCPILLMLYQIVSNQFTIAGRTYFNLIVLLMGLSSILLSMRFLTKNYGIEGSAFSLVCTYFLILSLSILIGRITKIFPVRIKYFVAIFVIFLLTLCKFMHVEYLFIYSGFSILILFALYKKEYIYVVGEIYKLLFLKNK